MSARKKNKNPWILFGLGSVSILLVTFFSIFFIHPSVPSRIGVAIVGSPTIVFSYDPIRQDMTAVRIPADVYTDVTRGYGTYPLSSIWKLDSIDKRRGMVFTETMEETTGIPIRYFLDTGNRGISPDTIESQLKSALSIPSCIRILLDRKRTNMPPWLLLEISHAFGSMNPTDMTFIDLVNEPVFISETLADGTMVKKIDAGKLSLLIGTHAEDAQIRKENLRIAVFNSTNSPGLAQKVTRILETTGFHVSSIANNESIRPDRCILRIGKVMNDTNTVKTLLWLYGCVIEEETTDTQADVTFIIGTDIEKRFFPF